MNKPVHVFLLMIALLLITSRIILAQPKSERIVHYSMKVSLDTEEKIVDGKMDMVWKNPSNDTINELQFHMYLNAFKNTESTFIKESGGQLRGMGISAADPMEWGWVDIVDMRTADGKNLTPNIKYIQPDDDNEKDQSVISVALEEPVMPAESIQLEIDFESKLPRVFARTGYSDNFFLVAQWFPKIGKKLSL